MMYVLRSPGGQLLASIDYYLVDDRGQLTFDGSGTHVWVEQVYLSAGAESRTIFRVLIQRIAEALPQAVDAYWYRHDKTGLRQHFFTRSQLVRGGMAHVVA